LANYILPLLAPFMKYWSTPKRAARLATKVLLNESGRTGIYYDDSGHPMLGSVLPRDPKFTDCVVAETQPVCDDSDVRGQEMIQFTGATATAELLAWA
jgi:hypothetical protein